MSHKLFRTPQLAAPELRMLLTLSRELFQTDEAGSSLRLVGHALADMTHPESALLLLRGARLELIGFDRQGKDHPAGNDHPMYVAGMAQLSTVLPSKGDSVTRDTHWRQVGPRMLALGVPVHAAVAALVVAWDRDLDATTQDRYGASMSLLLELATAALGKIDARRALEQLVGDQREHIARASLAHAAELARRDETETEMHLLSLTDVLTGLYNRRGFFVEAERIFKVSRRKRTRSAVIFADIDGLKRVNDQLGHDAGDALIRDAAFVLRHSFREADVVSRLGGDEFVAYTLDDEQPEVIRARVSANLQAFNLMQERPYTVSISTGLVQCDPLGRETLGDYVLQADEQMYLNKRSRLH